LLPFSSYLDEPPLVFSTTKFSGLIGIIKASLLG
jgi:hypothetical protein